jgi:hypothetical protein
LDVLPATFHIGTEEIEVVLKWLKMSPYCSSSQKLYNQDQGMIVCLTVGLMMRDISQMLAADEDEPLPKVLQSSKVPVSYYDTLVRSCKSMVEELESLVAEKAPEDEDNSISTPPPYRKSGRIADKPQRIQHVKKTQ